MGVRRAPLLLATTLALTAAAGFAAADLERWPAPATEQAAAVPVMAARIAAVPVAGRVPSSRVVPVPAQVPPPRAVPVAGRGPSPRAVPVPEVGRVPSPRPVPRVSVRRPAPPKRVTVGPTVKVPRVSTRRSPDPKVSISMPRAERRATPEVTVPHVTVYPDGVCAGGVVLGECPRREPRAVPREAAPPAAPPVVPPVVPPRAQPSPSPAPTPSGTPSARRHVQRAEPPARRRNPLNTVLLTVVLVTAITSTTAVAFRARR